MKDEGEARGEGARERWTVDGLEQTPRGPVARLEREGGRTFDLPVTALPGGVREGDVLGVWDGQGGVTVRVLAEETQARREGAQRRLNALNTSAAEGEEITL